MEASADYTCRGTPIYMSIEVLKSAKFSSKCDIFSLGLIIY